MLIPHIKYIESLVVSRKTLEQILEELEKYNLTIPDKAIAIIINTIKDSNPSYFDPVDPDPADPDWIEAMGIQEMFSHLTGFHINGDFISPKKAFQLISDPLMYRLVTALALARIDDQDIDMISNGKFNVEYAAEDIELFLKYFFNVSDWTLSERQQYVNNIEDPELNKYYKMALKGDKDYLLWKLGAAPEKDFGEMLRDMVNDSYYNFKEQSKIKPAVAQRWAGLAIKLTDRIDSLQKEDQKSAANFLENYEFKIKTNVEVFEKPKHLNDLINND